MSELINGDRSEYVIPPERKEHCPQCDENAIDRRAWRQMKSGQDTVRCFHCGQFLYCIPKSQSGIPRRSVKTRPEIDIATRAEVLERNGGRCFLCGRTADEGVILHVAHLVSVDDCKALNVPEEAWNEEYNLVALCEECNLGQAGRSMHPVNLMARLVTARHRWVRHPKYLAWLDSLK